MLLQETSLLKEYCHILKRLNEGRTEWYKTKRCPSSVYADDTALHRLYIKLSPTLQNLVCHHPAFRIINPTTGKYYSE